MRFRDKPEYGIIMKDVLETEAVTVKDLVEPLKNFPEKRQANGNEYFVPDIEEWKKDFEGLVAKLQKQLLDPTKTWRLEDLVKAMQENPGYFKYHKDEKWIKVEKILGEKP